MFPSPSDIGSLVLAGADGWGPLQPESASSGPEPRHDRLGNRSLMAGFGVWTALGGVFMVRTGLNMVRACRCPKSRLSQRPAGMKIVLDFSVMQVRFWYSILERMSARIKNRFQAALIGHTYCGWCPDAPLSGLSGSVQGLGIAPVMASRLLRVLFPLNRVAHGHPCCLAGHVAKERSQRGQPTDSMRDAASFWPNLATVGLR